MPGTQIDGLANIGEKAPAGPCIVLDLASDAEAAAVSSLVDQIAGALGSSSAVVVLLHVLGGVVEARGRLQALEERLAGAASLSKARISRSATDGCAAWAASTLSPIGVDIQSAPHRLDEPLLAASLCMDELAWFERQPASSVAVFARLWAGKEAVLKAFGVGLAFPPNLVPVLPMSAAWQPVSVPTLGEAWLSYPEHRGSASLALAIALNAGQGLPSRR
jgi:phosphopantetheinyl transferase